MSINLLTAKFIGAFGAGSAAIVGGGVGVGFYVNGARGGRSVERAPEYYHDYLKLNGLSKGVQSYLKSTEDFIEKKDTVTSTILAKVLTATDDDKNLVGKQLKCSLTDMAEENCTISLIQPNLTKTNIGKVLYSSLTPINIPKTEAPKDSYVVVEFSTKSDKIDGFKNKEITVKEESNALMTLAFDQPLFKETKTIDNKSIVALVPLKKNIVTYLAMAFLDEKNKLFANGFKPSSYNCSFIKKDGNLQPVGHTNVDDSCKIIQLDFPQAKETKLMTIKEVLESKKPLTDDYKKEFFKIELDTNKFFNFEEKIKKGGYRLQIKGINGSQQTEEGDFLLLQQIEDAQVKGATEFVIAKYKEASKLLTLNKKERGKCFLTKPASVSPGDGVICEIFLTTSPKEINKENFTQIEWNDNAEVKTITKDSYCIINFWGMQDIAELMNKKSVYFYKNDANSSESNSETYEFEIAALLMEASDDDGQNILITEIPNLTK